jgi:hypothetical protein
MLPFSAYSCIHLQPSLAKNNPVKATEARQSFNAAVTIRQMVLMPDGTISIR